MKLKFNYSSIFKTIIILLASIIVIGCVENSTQNTPSTYVTEDSKSDDVSIKLIKISTGNAILITSTSSLKFNVTTGPTITNYLVELDYENRATKIELIPNNDKAILSQNIIDFSAQNTGLSLELITIKSENQKYLHTYNFYITVTENPDVIKAREVKIMIDSISLDKLTLRDEQKVLDAQNAYNSLTAIQKTYIDPYSPDSVLTDLNDLITKISDLKISSNINKQIIELRNKNGSPYPGDKYDSALEKDISEIRKAYDSLSDNQKKYISDLTLLEEYENATKSQLNVSIQSIQAGDKQVVINVKNTNGYATSGAKFYQVYYYKINNIKDLYGYIETKQYYLSERLPSFSSFTKIYETAGDTKVITIPELENNYFYYFSIKAIGYYGYVSSPSEYYRSSTYDKNIIPNKPEVAFSHTYSSKYTDISDFLNFGLYPTIGSVGYRFYRKNLPGILPVENDLIPDSYISYSNNVSNTFFPNYDINSSFLWKNYGGSSSEKISIYVTTVAPNGQESERVPVCQNESFYPPKENPPNSLQLGVVNDNGLLKIKFSKIKGGFTYQLMLSSGGNFNFTQKSDSEVGQNVSISLGKFNDFTLRNPITVSLLAGIQSSTLTFYIDYADTSFSTKDIFYGIPK